GVGGRRWAGARVGRGRRFYRSLSTGKSPAMGGMPGACHGLELGFLFGTRHAPGMAEFSGTGPAADALERGLQDSWLAFARNGNPSCENVGEWPAFDAKSAKTMLLGERPSVQSAPFADEARAWA